MSHRTTPRAGRFRVAGVVVDLDDTLYPQSSWLHGAWHAVAAAAPVHDPVVLAATLISVASEGSDRGHIIDRALARAGKASRVDGAAVDVSALVEAFRSHAPAALDCYPGTTSALRALRDRVPVALVTDGDPQIQRSKLAALGLTEAFDAVVFSDEFGRELRKPDPFPIRAALERLSLRPEECVMVGDRPDKDCAGAAAAGMLGTVRVLTGEYSEMPPVAGTLVTVERFVDAVAWLRPALIRRVQSARPN